MLGLCFLPATENFVDAKQFELGELREVRSVDKLWFVNQDEMVTALRSVPGIGDWTASYIAMRALGEPDAFPSGDLVLRRMAGVVSPRELDARAEAWRPWRAYAVILLWQGATDRSSKSKQPRSSRTQAIPLPSEPADLESRSLRG